jgi:copper chaperone CopZ
VKSVAVNPATHNAKVEFDESVLPAQSLTAAIESTPHMMGAGMRYGGWLALKIPSITDEASGQKAKEVLAKLPGVRRAAIYPAQHSIAVLFDNSRGTLTTRQLIESLDKEGIEATSY